jgi:hypothetical protein
MNSLGAILSTQFNIYQNSPYNQPMIADQSLGINLNDDSQLIMGYKTDCNNETSLSPVRYAANGNTAAWLDNLNPSGPFNNMGVPGLSVFNTSVAGYSDPYYDRFASGGTNTIMDDALANNPTFFLVDLGQDELMNYALSGGESAVPLLPGSGPGGFGQRYAQVILDLIGETPNGVITNIPDILQFPYFTTIPYDGLELDAENANTMNQVFNPLGMSFVEGPNPFTVEDPNEPFGVRKLEEGELILLSVPLDSVKCNGMGSIIPIPEEYVLSLDEINYIEISRTAFNNIIENQAENLNLALADFNSLFNSVNSTLVHNGVSFSGEFVSGGFFSLDGRNPTSKGMALLANECIRAINKQYSANIPFAKVGDYDGIKFP